MKVVDFNGKSCNWPPPGYEVALDDIRPRSELHIRCRSLLRTLYPTQPVLEEVPIPGLGLFIDFYLPMRKLAIECNGKQHDTYVPHFHGTKMNFVASQQRDKRKAEWCQMNNVQMVVLPFNETDEEWLKRITQ